MNISNQDRRRLEVLLILCENLEDLAKRIILADDMPSPDDSPIETLTEFIKVIGIVSRWLSPEFKEETRTQMMWGSLAMLRYNYSYSDDGRGSQTDWEIATTDIYTLIDLCQWWLKTVETAPMPLNAIAGARGGNSIGNQN